MSSRHLSLRKRHHREKRFRLYGLISILLSLAILASLVGGLIQSGLNSFFKAQVKTTITFDKSKSFEKILDLSFPGVEAHLLSPMADISLHQYVKAHSDVWGTTTTLWLPLYDGVDQYLKGQQNLKLSKQDVLKKWKQEGRVALNFNQHLFFSSDSREPEIAGIWGAVMGTIYTLLVTFLVAFPLGIGTAIYLEEFARKNRWTHFIEVNINNLASVPSIIFGLLGLAIYINFFGLPRSSPLVGGLTLALITMPTLVIAARSALSSIPKSIRQAAQGLGASDLQVTFHHVLPLAMPGILTGTILGMSRALGESAPLLMIGMAAFVIDVPTTLLDPATTLPVQIFSWVRNPEHGFVENAAGGILVLLLFLGMMNLGAIWLRQKFHKEW